MVHVKVAPLSITEIRKNGVEYIVNWFDQHNQSFYPVGWSFLKNQQQMEELFYQSILKVHKELPRFKGETSFETWVTSIFLNTCQELSEDKSLQVSEKSEPRQDIYKALDQLKQGEKEAVVLTYMKGISQEEAAQLLQIPLEKMKGDLFSGIQSLRNGMGFGTNIYGCKEYQKYYIDYLEKTLDRSKKIDLEVHIHHCQECQEDMAAFQDVMLTLLNFTEKMADFHVPSNFMENVKERLSETEKDKLQRNKKLKRRGLVFAGIFALIMGIGFFTGAFTSLYYSWTEKDQQLLAFLQQGLGERLNLEDESNGLKIKIKSAIADDVQTLVFYEIEDTDEDNQYAMNYQDGVIVENEHKIMSSLSYPKYHPPDLESDINNEKKNVYHGKMSLPSLRKDSGTIKLKITKLQKLIREKSDHNDLRFYGTAAYETGEWNFEISVTKQPSVEYVLDEETEVEGIPVRFDKLTIAPTATLLHYRINSAKPEKRIEAHTFGNLEVNNKKAKPYMYGSHYVDSRQDMDWNTFQLQFDSLYGENPKKVNVHFESVYLVFEDKKEIKLDASREYPQTFQYKGSTISIDEVESGNPASVVISNHEIHNREYESLFFNIKSENESEISSIDTSSEGVIVDKNGIEYDMNERFISYDDIEQPRHFVTVQSYRLHGNNVVPVSLEIFGYNTTKYLDDIVTISLKKEN